MILSILAASLTLDALNGLRLWPFSRGRGATATTSEDTGPPDEPEPPSGGAPEPTGLPIYTAGSLHEAQLVLDLLDEAGIPARLFNTHLLGAMGELPVSQCWPKIWLLDAEDVERARGVISTYEENKRAPSLGDRPCDACGEESPANFELCWSCRAPFPE